MPITSPYLFGDDLAKQLRDAKEASRISHSFASLSKSGPFKEKQQTFNQHDHPSKGPKRDFFVERPKPALQKEKNAKHRQEIMEQLLQIKDRVSVFGSFLPQLVNYLQMLCHTFTAGQVAAHFAAWRTLTSDKIILSDVLGAAVECTAIPVQHKLPNQIFSDHEYHIVRQEVHKLLEKCVVTKVSPISGQILSNVVLRPKKDGTHRLILNLKRFNESVSHYHFKMDLLSTITKLVTQNCYMAAVDMKDAYYSIPIRFSDRKFLRFIREGEL